MLNTNERYNYCLYKKNLSFSNSWLNGHRLLIYGGKLLFELFPHKEMYNQYGKDFWFCFFQHISELTMSKKQWVFAPRPLIFSKFCFHRPMDIKNTTKSNFLSENTKK